MFLKVLGQSRMDKSLNQKRIMFAGRKCYIKHLEKKENELKALAMQGGRQMYLFERFNNNDECEKRYSDLIREKI